MSTRDYSANHMITKEEKEQMLNRKIEEIRRKNEETMKKYKMKEEDRQLAEKSGCSVTLELASASKKDKTESVGKNSSSTSDYEKRPVKTANTVEDWDGDGISQTQTRSQANQLNRNFPRLPKDAVQNDKQPTKIASSVTEDWDGDGTTSVPVTQQIRRRQNMTTTTETGKGTNGTTTCVSQQATQQSRRQPKPSVGAEDWDGDATSATQQGRRQPKTATGAVDDWNGDGTTAPSVTQQGKRQSPNVKPQSKNAPRLTHSLSEGPPPDPVYSFLADASRDGQPEPAERSPKAASANLSRRHPRNFGGERFEGVTEKMQQEKERKMNHRDPAPNGEAQTKMDYLLRTTGKERLEYEKWRAEQDKIDRERLQRHKNAAGEWRLEWDREKVSQIEDEMASVSIRPATRQSQPPVTWQPQPAAQQQQDQFTWQQQPTIRRLQSAVRPAGRIGSGRFATSSGDGPTSTMSPPSPSVPSNKGLLSQPSGGGDIEYWD